MRWFPGQPLPASARAGLALAISCCASCSALRPAPTPPRAAAPLVMAHYMPWFRAERAPDGSVTWDHWQWFGKGPKHDPGSLRADGRPDLAAVDEPLIGPYDGRDVEVLTYHVRTAQAAGIGGFIADWYGPGTYTDEVFARLLDVSEAEDSLASLCLEEKTFFPGYAEVASREGAVAEMTRQVTYALERYAGRKGYWKVGGVPVFLLFRNHQDGLLGHHVLTPAEQGQVRDAVGSPFLLVLAGFDEGYRDGARGSFAWIGDDAYLDWYHRTAQAWRTSGHLALWLGSANPGFDDTGVWGWGQGPRVTARRDGAEYARYWSDLRAHPPDVVQIVTWNDFNEGSTIEPARSYGFAYVDQTEREVGRLTGRTVALADNTWPYRTNRLRAALRTAPPDTRTRGEAALDRWLQDERVGRRFRMETRLRDLERTYLNREEP